MKKIYTFLFLVLSLTVVGQVNVSIPEIQGSGNVSPYNGQNVKTTGVVTAVFTGNENKNGFFSRQNR